MLEASKLVDLCEVDLVLEPEAASINCLTNFPTKQMLHVGFRYMIIDAGGGTVDIAVHETESTKAICELYPPTGGPWGSTFVNKRILKILNHIFGVDTMKLARTKNGWTDVLDAIETQKLNVKTTDSPNVLKNIQLTCVVGALRERNLPSMGELVTAYNNKHSSRPQILCDDGMVRLPSSLFSACVKKLAGKVVQSVGKILADVDGISYIYLVGGFFHNEVFKKVLQDELKTPSRPVVLSQKPGVAILEGAPIFALAPLSVSSRCVPYTYAITRAIPWDSSIHQGRPKREFFGKYWCYVLVPIVRARQRVRVNQAFPEEVFPLDPQQAAVHVDLYKSKNKDLAYPEDPHAILVKGGLDMYDIPHVGEPNSNRKMKLSMTFGGPYITLTVEYVRTGKKVVASYSEYLG
eukprot:TRINITY_DN14193_c0_g1_i1.p1 TRINITY_DN14193_c0_g1~~TRINITY_DN14193_c0_g1_i1.p1  ORF type:complete len:407 (+),score=46.41 TRINITY_DN14193_c0_g1_i1:88-1308(+)